MKNILFSTTALAAVSALALSASVASAAEKKKKPEPLKISVGGFMHSMMGFGSNDSTFEADSAADVSRVSYDSFNMVQDSEVYFKGTTTLDNGIALSVTIQLEGDQTGGGVADATFMKMTGGFGDIRIGSHAGVAATMVHKGQMIPGPIGLDTPDSNSYVVNPTNNQNGATPGTTIGGGDQIKFIYISPKFGGAVYLAAAYTPSETSTNAPPATGGNAGTEGQTYQAVVSFEDKVGSTDIKADVAYWETHADANGTFSGLRGGANIGVGGMTVGFGWLSQSNLDSGKGGTTASDDREVWDIGIKYAAGDYTVGASYISAEHDSAGGDDTVEKWGVGASYSLGEGVTGSAGAYHVTWDDVSTALADNNSGWAVVAGVKVAF